MIRRSVDNSIFTADVGFSWGLEVPMIKNLYLSTVV